ncbi:membrane protein implicated in regulation of membrane protease activity [Streptomyces umbrinus]|uniref:Membrane protein implicated in regulation of membrane protease activity n=1 Tax=Streptomyces umbrinus TaxID=67370 RepID=A0ABU0SG31_9ACTN|nr:hypothetical protein [Streptomyces umbrinus]MDQ1022502.1 membrane protein implicated in regulation of membrane protease activity [Streptomyces umbrinus]
MKLKDAWAIRDSACGTASSVARQLALAGVAVVWLLGGGLQATGVRLNNLLLAAGLALVVMLFLDLTQYLITTGVWAPWARRMEKEAQGWKKEDDSAWKKEKVVDEEEVGGAADWFNRPTWVVFVAKMVILVVAYFFIFIDLADRITLS